VIRRHVGWSAAILALAFVLVLAVPDHDRGLALFAFLLLAGALVLSVLVLALAGEQLAAEDRLAGVPASSDSAPAELSALASSIRTALRERTIDERVYAAIRAVASVRLARNHGIELARDPGATRELLGGGLLWQLLESERTWTRLRVGGSELTQIVDQLERL
jgi:CHASE2 domain-containing sensor protein